MSIQWSSETRWNNIEDRIYNNVTLKNIALYIVHNVPQKYILICNYKNFNRNCVYTIICKLLILWTVRFDSYMFMFLK